MFQQNQPTIKNQVQTWSRDLTEICDMVDLGKYSEPKPNRFRRVIWAFLNSTLFRVCPNATRNTLLRLFGAKIGRSLVYRTANVYDPANLIIGDLSCIGPHVELYCKDKITIGNNTVISQWAYVCTASHDITSPVMALKTKPIAIGDGAWVAAHAKILPGITVANNAVIALGSVVTKNISAMTVVGGNPATFIKHRALRA